MPALGLAQDTGNVLHWLEAEGELVIKGDPLIEIETDKTTVGSGRLYLFYRACLQ